MIVGRYQRQYNRPVAWHRDHVRGGWVQRHHPPAGSPGRGMVQLSLVAHLSGHTDIAAYRLLVTLLRVLEMAGCRNFSATMTRMAMKARMRAYSTMPWPSSARSRSLATRVCAATICLVTNSLMNDISRNSVFSLTRATRPCRRAGDTMSDEACAPQRPIGYRLPSNRLPLAHNSAIISLVH